MKDEYSLGKFHGVHGTVGAAHIILNDFKYAATKPLEDFGSVVAIARLRQRQSKAKTSPYIGSTRSANVVL